MSISNIHITPSTSLVLIKNINFQTNIYLSTLNVPDFQVKIRDTTGSQLLATNPINISTIGGASFTDNSYYYAINKPFGFANLSLRNSTSWQILHTSGQVPAESAADVQTTIISTSYFALMSTNLKRVSTMQIQNLLTPNSIDVTGPFVVGNLSTPGFILLKSSLNVYGNTVFDKNFFVSGGSIFKSSLSAEVLLPLSSILLSYSSIGVGENLFVGNEVTVFSTFQIKGPVIFDNLHVQRSTTGYTIETSTLQIGNTLSTLKELYVASTLQIGSNIDIYQNVSSLSGLFSTNELNLEGPLQVGGTFSTLSSLQFLSSLQLNSSLTIQSDFIGLSTANITNILSTALFVTNLLSSSTSFSTAGEFAIIQTLTTKTNLSTFQTIIPTTFSTGSNFVTLSYLSTYGQARVSSLEVYGNAQLSTLDVFSSIGISEDLHVAGDVRVDSLSIQSPLTVGSNLFVRERAQFNQNVGVRSNIYVKGNMAVDGIAYIPSFDVPSYQVSTLEILTSSPAIGLRASTLFLQSTTNLDSLEAHLIYDDATVNIVMNVEPQIGRGSTFAANVIYADRFSENYISTFSLYTESLINNDTVLNKDSYPSFEILQSSLFLRGLSTNLVVSDRIIGQTFYGNFIGSAELLSNIPLAYSNISANTMTASTVSTALISSQFTELANPNISSFFAVEKALYFATPAAFLSTNIQVDSNLFFGLFGPSNTPFFQSVDPSTLTLNNTLYFDSGNKKLGVLTSSPQYSLDISGSLYYSGFLYYGKQENMLHFSTGKDKISFSTILYSSIYIQDTLQIPQNTSWPLENLLTVSYVAPNTTPGPIIPLVLAESYFPIVATTDPLYESAYYFSTGIFTNSNYSTLDINYHLITYNETKNVGILTTTLIFDENGYIASYYPAPLPSTYDLVVQGDFQTSELRTSTMYLGCKLTASTIEMPTFGINPITVSTFHTLSTSYVLNLNDSLLTLDSFVDFYKASTLQGSLCIKKPKTTAFGDADFCVYSNAYISSVVSQSLHATNLFVGTQTI